MKICILIGSTKYIARAMGKEDETYAYDGLIALTVALLLIRYVSGSYNKDDVLLGINVLPLSSS